MATFQAIILATLVTVAGPLTMPPKTRVPLKTKPLVVSLAWLVPQTGELEGNVFPLHDGVTIGSGPGADIVLNDLSIADVHASIHHQDDRWWIEDAGSGKVLSVLNRLARKRERIPLNDDDTIVLGSISFVLKVL